MALIGPLGLMFMYRLKIDIASSVSGRSVIVPFCQVKPRGTPGDSPVAPSSKHTQDYSIVRHISGMTLMTGKVQFDEFAVHPNAGVGSKAGNGVEATNDTKQASNRDRTVV